MALEVDENLVRAVERLIDGGRNHHWYGTICRYRAAAREGDESKFRSAELLLRSDVLNHTREHMPEAYRDALAALVDRVNGGPVPCEGCGRPKLHGTRCPGTRGELGKAGEPCWAIYDACDGCGGLCCGCREAADKAKGEA